MLDVTIVLEEGVHGEFKCAEAVVRQQLQVDIAEVVSKFKPSQIRPEAVQASVESAVELGKWFHQSFRNTVYAPAMVQKFKTERQNLILLPRPCVRDAAELISHAARAHVSLGGFCSKSNAASSHVTLGAMYSQLMIGVRVGAGWAGQASLECCCLESFKASM